MYITETSAVGRYKDFSKYLHLILLSRIIPIMYVEGISHNIKGQKEFLTSDFLLLSY